MIRGLSHWFASQVLKPGSFDVRVPLKPTRNDLYNGWAPPFQVAEKGGKSMGHGTSYFQDPG